MEPFNWIVLRLERNTSAHFIAQKSANSGFVTSASISAPRLAPPAWNAVTSAAVGSRPTVSRNARRTNSASVHKSDGRIVIRFNLAKAWASMKLFSGTAGHANPARGSRYVSRTLRNSSR